MRTITLTNAEAKYLLDSLRDSTYIYRGKARLAAYASIERQLLKVPLLEAPLLEAPLLETPSASLNIRQLEEEDELAALDRADNTIF